MANHATSLRPLASFFFFFFMCVYPSVLKPLSISLSHFPIRTSLFISLSLSRLISETLKSELQKSLVWFGYFEECYTVMNDFTQILVILLFIFLGFFWPILFFNFLKEKKRCLFFPVLKKEKRMKNEEQSRSLFGISLSDRPTWQQFLICTSGFFFGYLVNGVCEVLFIIHLIISF